LANETVGAGAGGCHQADTRRRTPRSTDIFALIEKTWRLI